MRARTLDVLECKYTQSVELSSVGGDREIEGDPCPRADWATIRGWSIVPQTYQRLELGNGWERTYVS